MDSCLELELPQLLQVLAQSARDVPLALHTERLGDLQEGSFFLVS